MFRLINNPPSQPKRRLNRPPASYQELSQYWQEGKDYRIRIRHLPSRMAVLAPHGGGIEPGTSEIAEALAGEHFSFYCFEGLRDAGNWNLHLTSRYFDETICLGLLGRSPHAIAVHGCQGQEQAVFVGGLDQSLKQRVIAALLLAGFDAQEDRSHHAGLDARNLCNRALSGRGLQIELSLGLRRALFLGLKQAERASTTPMFERFVRAVQKTLVDLDGLEANFTPSVSALPCIFAA